MKIGIKNFRVFKEMQTFDIRPITILLGPNNAGKSSFTKLLLLLRNGIERLDFSKGDHNLESFEKVKNWDSDSDEICLELDFAQDLLPGGSLKIYYKDLGLSKVEVGIPGQSPILSKSYEKEDVGGFVDTQFTEKIDLFQLMDLIYDGKSKEINQLLNDQISDEQWEAMSRSRILNDQFVNHMGPQDINFSNLDKFFKIIYSALKPEHKTVYFRESLRNLALKNELNEMKRDYLLYRIKYGEQDITDACEKIVLEVINAYREGKKYGMAVEPWIESYNNSLNRIDKWLQRDITKKIIEDLKLNVSSEQDLIFEYTSIGKILFQRLLGRNMAELKMSATFPEGPEFPDSDSSTMEFQSSLLDGLSLNPDRTFNFHRTHYISANRGSQKRALLTKGESQMDEIVHNYVKDKQKEYEKNALKIFNLHGELEVERFENFASAVYFKNEHGKISVADLGYGYSQIIPIIMGIKNQVYNDIDPLLGKIEFVTGPEEALKAMTDKHPEKEKPKRKISTHGTYFIIEEPEANLHPNLQSKFSDFLELTIDNFQNFHFVIETHSEYIIRKLQYLVANKSIAPEEIVIYYFNDDKYVTNEEPKVKEIEITENGNLTDSFGPGFYDEATRLKFDLMRVNKEQQN